ncbi:MAG TPA: GxxExxY protein [Prolixibacteraceae bacterium]|nr:GxxExxY protein [Prolixibacteraceae bacterium]
MTEKSCISENCPLSDLTDKIIECAIEVRKYLGDGFQEIIYHQALAFEFTNLDLFFEYKFEMPLFYKGKLIGTRRNDFFVEGKMMVEIKAVTQLEGFHFTQTVSYLEAYKMETGLLINFGSKSLEFKRVMNKKSKFS